jgi:hypothetical protein
MSQDNFVQYDSNFQYPAPSKTFVVHKRIWNADQEIFEPVTFVRVFGTNTELNSGIDFHTEHYGAPRRGITWWHDYDSIWLREDLATFWLLKIQL